MQEMSLIALKIKNLLFNNIAPASIKNLDYLVLLIRPLLNDFSVLRKHYDDEFERIGLNCKTVILQLSSVFRGSS